jgi:rubrerythrin
MESDQKELFKEAMQVELNVSKLYRLYSEIFKEDSNFWQQLSIEEMNHATLIKTGIEEFLDNNLFPEELVFTNLNELKQINYVIKQLKEEYSKNPPDKNVAYDIALNIEQSNQEKQFSMFIEKTPPESKAMKLFQSLNGDNKNHIQRIRNLIKKIDD